jgi:rhodanese-related sulfurtransferase
MASPETPIRKAVREARIVLIAAPLIAIAYNLFASTKIPWIREVHKGDTVSYEQLMEGGDRSATSHDTAAGLPVQATTPSIDTANASKLQQTDSALAAQQKAIAEQKRLQDSASRAIAALAQKGDTLSVKPVQVTPQKNSPQNSPPEALAREIGTSTARRIFDGKKALFIDARPAEQFSQGHIPGAINIYAEDFRDHIPELLKLPMDTLVVAYCGGGLCELSHELADQLRTLGFKKVVVYTGGTTEWNENNYPFTSNK